MSGGIEIDMSVCSFPGALTSIPSVLPSPIQGVIALRQGRLALQSGDPNRAIDLAKDGVAVLERRNGSNPRNSSPVNLRYTPALKAAFMALLATAQKRI